MITQTASTSEEYRPTKLRNAPLQAMDTAGTHFLLRTCVDRLAGGGTHTIAFTSLEIDLLTRLAHPRHDRNLELQP